MNVGDGGTTSDAFPYARKFIHWGKAVVDGLDLSHSVTVAAVVDGLDLSHSVIVAGCKRRQRVGLTGADEAKNGIFKAAMDSLVRDSKLKDWLGSLVGDERGRVTGALFDIWRGGSDEEMELCRNANEGNDVLASSQDGLGKEDDDGLSWHDEGIGLAKYEDGGLGFLEELGVMFIEVPPVSLGAGLNPYMTIRTEFILDYHP